MTQIRERTVLFADLRGSTGLFETLGNAEATSLVTQTVGLIAQAVDECKGRLVKTLGDGLMAVFETPNDGVQAAIRMHEMLERVVARGKSQFASPGLRALRMQVALARGEVVEMNGDCFGDAVNVAARLLNHAGDNETLITAEVLNGLPSAKKLRFRSLDLIAIRGRAEPVHVHVLDQATHGDVAATQFGEVQHAVEPDGIRLVWLDLDRVFDVDNMPIILGRSVQATYCITDARVSRSHARIDWHAGSFSITDLSYNGSFVRFGSSGDVVSLKRGSCTLHGSGVIGLGSPPVDATSPIVKFEVLHFADTEPHSFGHTRSRG
ncbi:MULTISPECIES: adenylate/guanylate cyclase domain-containing protein [Roseateles]|uniref:Adenylate/guanylate cyclase domain-containing protein n=1 Tax=Roseateles albus TaxID=2987525 RepID=A0ABT5KA98_9BURK|nr:MULTISPECIES: adenylate/guanylate cyclase domain-containing protein [Roseateles]MCV2357737.1 adenylate/guanylate cyclase domain-containing protein [Paucibacter sp. TC2R-5]MDC8770783.1 adenylate/guanylate cyclase domain-containing protein [Roseateles albus]